MKKIYESYRQFLSEAAKTIEDMVQDNLMIWVESHPGEDDHVHFMLTPKGSSNIWAEIEINYLPVANVNSRMVKNASSYGECLRAYQVIWSNAKLKYGPLLYDVAMEYASANATGLTCDRAVVSSDAYKVWNYYLQNRSDVKIYQLDDPKNTLTPTDRDNCVQISADYASDKFGAKGFPQSPLSKVYRKEGTSTIDKLKELGRLSQQATIDPMDHADYGMEL